MKTRYLALILFLTILLSPEVSALGISPSRTILDFEPGLERTFQFYALNTQNTELNLEVYVTGALSEYVTTSTDSLHLSPAESMKGFTVSIKLPQDLEKPGIHDTRIGIVESLPGGKEAGTSVAARVGVESQLWIRVPYPGIYAEINLETEDVAVGEDAEFTIGIHNRGTDPITAQGTVKIYDGENMVASLNAGSVFLESKESDNLKVVWSTEGFDTGVYRAVATVKYDGESRETEKTFKIGALTVDLAELHRKNVFPGEIAKMLLEVKSFWNEPITGVYAELETLEGDNVLDKSKSETFDLDPWEARNVTIYVDTEGFDIGEYSGRVTLHYAGQEAVKTFQDRLEVSVSYDIYIYLAAAVIIVLAAAVVFRKKKTLKKTK